MANDFTWLFVGLLTATLLHPANAFNPAKDRWQCKQGDAICVTSFRWCSSNDQDTSKGCSFPENTYPYYNREEGMNPALVLWDEKYNLSWASADPDYPVLVNWRFGRYINATTSESYSWSKRDNSFSFTFKELAADFPTKKYDINSDEVKSIIGSVLNSFTVSQPEKPYGEEYTSNPWVDTSDQFSVFDDIITLYLDAQESAAKGEVTRRWKLGVGIGVGIGVPLLMAVSFLIGMFMKGGAVPKSSGLKTSDGNREARLYSKVATEHE
ncbi:hypothetical protein BGZ61DRAFT_167882 [Ilyonectria robusta]|uniref:uncharacterized protein n=1 Tax=Ilyonectria robusta TaxID=1079257 RepID=UPI001E8D6427|nr:uncharacterized protein BGZ61DRAFT_167882 [Ilyonectria robusta]KAH8733908.1 hypothetical protein BGZ61DRAFT_167882 [Ilyonectria robusta]